MNAIETVGLTKNYGSLCAVDGLSISVDNEVYGCLGPNGSGKTTTIRMLTSLLTPTSGTACVCGHDIVDEPAAIRRCISYVPQDMAVDIRLTGRENVDFFARLYGIRDRAERERRVNSALEVMSLTDRADDITKTYSGGMRRRLELSQALVHEPQVLFLDEPTIGLDVAARKTIWKHISKLRRQGMTIFVTTHHMDEAEKYCNRVGIMKKGVLIKEGTPDKLRAELMNDMITVRLDGKFPDLSIEGVSIIDRGEDDVTLSAEDGSVAVPRIVHELERMNFKVESISVREPTLEDVYLQSVDVSDDTTPFDARRFRNMMYRR